MKRTLVIAVPSIAIILAVYFLFVREPADKKFDTAASSTVTRAMSLRRGEIRVSVSATGVVTPINVIEIKSKASGIVETIPIEASDHVRVGQLICKLDQTDTRNAFEQALADSMVAASVLVQQENNWKRAQDLFAKNLISQEEFDQAHVEFVRSRSSVVKAVSNLVLARQKLAETIVLSPIRGLVLSRTVSAGQIVSSAVSNVGGGTTIARVANMDEVYVVASVDEVDIGKVGIEQETRIVADAYPDDFFTGKVVRIAAQSTVVQNVTTFDVVILVPNRGNKLKSGMNATITIDIASRDDALIISNELLRDQGELETDRKTLAQAGVALPDRSAKSDAASDSSRRIVRTRQEKRAGMSSNHVRQEGQVRFVVTAEGDRLVLKPVRIGLANFDETEILDGLTDSSKVLLVKFSQAKKESEEFKERMKSRSGLGR